MSEPLWIAEAETVSALSLPEAIGALEKGLALEAAGAARNMAKTHQVWGGHNTLHAIGAVVEGAGLVGTKTWAHTDGGATPLLLLWDSNTGKLLAIIEAFALGQMRTGGISGVATNLMARPDADDFALVGTGKQAITQVAAVAAVRRLKRVRVFSPTAANRKAFVARLQKTFSGIAIEEGASVEATVKDASIVTVVTRARSPIITAAMLAKGAHFNAVGAITPEREEFTQDVFDRVEAIAVDTPDSVRNLSAEFRKRFSNDWSKVQPLSALVGKGNVRTPSSRSASDSVADAVGQKNTSPTDLTLFKAMGMGLSDLALGMEILSRMKAKGGGRTIPHPERSSPRLV